MSASAYYSVEEAGRTWIALKHEGEEVGWGRVRWPMLQGVVQGPNGAESPGALRSPDPKAARRPDLVERDFSAPAPNRLLVGDFTYLRAWEGISYRTFVLDAFSRRVVGWQLGLPHAHRPRPRYGPRPT